MFKKSFGWLVTALLVWSAPVQAKSGFVSIGEGQQLYVDHLPAAPGQRTLVILNGLTYTTENWDKIMPGLVGHGYGILRYDPKGMGRTLDKYGAPGVKIAIEAQAEDLNRLLDVLMIRGKVDLLGLSYGGGLAMVYASRFPERVQTMILQAPYVKPVEGQDRWIRAQIAATRVMYPFNPASDDELYDYFLHQIVYSTYPQAEPVVLRRPYTLEAVFRMVQGIRKIDATRLVQQFPVQSLHLMIAGRDQYIGRSVHDSFWNTIPQSVRMSRIVVAESEHKIPEATPKFSASWINLIMANDPRLVGGAAFDGSARTGVAQSGKVEIKLSKDLTW